MCNSVNEETALTGYCTCEASLLHRVGGLLILTRADLQKGQGVDFFFFKWWRDKHATSETFSQVFFIPMSLYPLMYLDKKKIKIFFFFVVRHCSFTSAASHQTAVAVQPVSLIMVLSSSVDVLVHSKGFLLEKFQTFLYFDMYEHRLLSHAPRWELTDTRWPTPFWPTVLSRFFFRPV